MLKATNLTFAGVGRSQSTSTPILQNINIGLHPGVVTAIIGPNGAGKSTLLKALGGLITPTFGQVELEIQGTYRVISSQKTQTPGLRQAVWESLSWYGDSSPMPFGFSVYDVVMMGRYPRHQGWPSLTDRDKVQATLELFELTAFAQRSVLTLSSGELQKVMLARVFANDPRVMLLDEPISHLDPRVVVLLGKLLKKKAQEGAAIAVVLHDVGTAFRWADRIALLDKGALVAEGAPGETKITESFRRIFELSLGTMVSPQGDSVVYFF